MIFNYFGHRRTNVQDILFDKTYMCMYACVYIHIYTYIYTHIYLPNSTFLTILYIYIDNRFIN